MNHVNKVADLAQSIDALSAALEILVADLHRERDALRQRANADDLEQIATRKAKAVESVAGLYNDLREALVSCTERTSVEDAMSRLRDFAPKLDGRVEKLVALIRTCQLSNQENGALVGAGLRNAQGALDTLHKLSAANTTGVYGASGHTDLEQTSSHRLTVRA